MSNEKSNLVNFQEVNRPKLIFGGSEVNGQTNGVGEIRKYGLIIKDVSYVEGLNFNILSTYQDGLIIKDVLYVEGLNFNLLSTIQFCDKRHKVEFTKDGCYIKDEDSFHRDSSFNYEMKEHVCGILEYYKVNNLLSREK